MSVIVMGMEMPENCSECRLMADYWCYAKTINGQPGPTFMDHRPDWCPLRPLPEKHGRLIDADTLHSLYERRWHDLQVLNWDENPTAEHKQTGINWCINTLHDDAPTIVEAEGFREAGGEVDPNG